MGKSAPRRGQVGSAYLNIAGAWQDHDLYQRILF
ncbi:hypothetical protein RCH07_003471 [Arthrobacter sp. CG_A4]|nr:hypothetical protein [Arthrobacter sp. CG_A4]